MLLAILPLMLPLKVLTLTAMPWPNVVVSVPPAPELKTPVPDPETVPKAPLPLAVLPLMLPLKVLTLTAMPWPNVVVSVASAPALEDAGIRKPGRRRR